MSRLEKRIKICGLTRREDILAVNEWKPDYVGLVFAPGKRQLTPVKAQSLKEILLPEIPAAGVFVNSPMEDILSLADSRTIDLIQLHGDEDQEYILTLKDRMNKPLPIIKAVRVRTAADMLKAQNLSADYLLFDTYTKGLYGGSGMTFDWSMIPAVKKPWFLAGGLNASNLLKAMKTEAFCLDLSSAVETDGRKDPEKIKQIIQIVRSGNQCQKEDSDSTGDNLSRKR